MQTIATQLREAGQVEEYARGGDRKGKTKKHHQQVGNSMAALNDRTYA
ncbi:hypothetical protein SDC9_95297 [bioreactor metagenome]|uniref:Uncharacterized protein n=1 Tax=bioreactor metagenome TaxID=1076179 RepID=A0A645A653_9ZZZZ